MPETMANSVEAIIQRWYVDEGVDYAAGSTILAIETEKAVVDIEEEKAGVILRKLFPENKAVEVGVPIALIGAPGEKVDDIDALLETLGVDAVAAKTEKTVAATPVPTSAAPIVVEHIEAGDRIFASPLARKLAKEKGLSLAQLIGTGPNGRITRNDVHSAKELGYEVIPHSMMRKAIASRLVQSKQEVPHFYLRATAQADTLLALRTELNSQGKTKISVNDMIVKIAARAHVLVPDVNVIWTPTALHKFEKVDISIAVAGERGLVTPVIRDVDSKSVFEIADVVLDFKTRISANQLKQNEIEGGSLSISNLGMYGTEEFAAIINPPQAAILAVGAARKEAIVIDDKIEIVSVIHFTLSVDHRSVDGALAAQWMQVFVGLIQEPREILL